jgi:hypothetical protein
MKKVLLLVVSLLYGQFGYCKDIGQLTTAVSNNAVAAAKTASGWRLYSFNGLLKGKDHKAVTNLAQQYDLSSGQSKVIEGVPFKQGRLASIAVTVKNQIYLFGGYTVSADHQEKSMADVYQFDPVDQSFNLFTQMPISVDDTVAVVDTQAPWKCVFQWELKTL